MLNIIDFFYTPVFTERNQTVRQRSLKADVSADPGVGTPGRGVSGVTWTGARGPSTHLAASSLASFPFSMEAPWVC